MYSRRTIWMRWVWANGCGLLLGLALHSLLVHAASPRGSAPIQASHTVLRTAAFSAIALAVCFAQQSLLKLIARVSWRDVFFQTGLTVSAFWVGYYAVETPFSHLLGLSLLGSAVGWILRTRSGEWRRWMWISSGGFFASSLVEFLAAQPFGFSLTGPSCFFNHVVGWTYLGLFAGIASGALTGLQLARSLRRSSHRDLTVVTFTSERSLHLLLGR